MPCYRAPDKRVGGDSEWIFFSDFPAGTCVVTSHWNRLDETVLVKTVLMMGHGTYLPIGRYV